MRSKHAVASCVCFDGNIYFVVDIRAYLSICDTTWHHGVQRLCFCERWPREPQTRAADASPLYLSEPREAGHDGVGFGRRFVRGQKSDPLHLPISSAEIG